MTPGITQMTSGSGSNNNSGGTSTSPAPPVTENMFLQLLVAQLQHQDPSNPADSTQFVTQLAQFQTMEQSLNQGQDLAAMHQDLDRILASLNATASNAAANK